MEDFIKAFRKKLADLKGSLLSEASETLYDLKEINTLLTEISQANTSLTKSALAKLKDHSFSIASQYGKTAVDYLSGVQAALQAGYTSENAAAIAELSLALQSVSGMTAEFANQSLFAADEAYHLGGSVEKLTEILDGCYQIASHNPVSMEELAQGMSLAGTQAASLGVKANETTAILSAIISAAGQSGAKAASAWNTILLYLRQIIREEQGVSAESLIRYQEACSALHVSLQETKKGIVSLRAPMEILRDLSKEYSNLALGDPRKTNLLQAFPDPSLAEAFQAVLENYDVYEKMLAQYAQGTGSLAAGAGQTADSWEGALNRLSNTWTSTIDKMADSDAVLSIVNMLNSLLSAGEQFTGWLGTLGTLAAGAGLFAGLKNVGEEKRYSFHCFCFEQPTIVCVLRDTGVFVRSNARYAG